MNRPLISIIIPVYNCENYIKECLEAIILNFNAKYKMQVIIIDDGSRDNTANICKDYQKRYRNITYKYQENQGVSVARNTGLYMTDAKFVMFVKSQSGGVLLQAFFFTLDGIIYLIT